MKIGMLWRFDFQTFEDDLCMAERLFNAKHGSRIGGMANAVYVHPDDDPGVSMVNGVKVYTSSQTPRHHMWIGLERNG